MNITLEPAPNKQNAPGDYFSPGERIIYVDGIRWGRTHIRSHGRRGRTFTFSQEGGETLMHYAYKGAHKMSEVAVFVAPPGRRWEKGTPASAEEAVLLKVRELIASEQLRDPEIVRREVAARREAFQKGRQAAAAAEEEEFRQKATEAIKDTILPPGLRDELIGRVVAAMRWAQTR